MALDATQRALARTTLAGIVGAYMSAMVRGEGALALSILELFQDRYNRWFEAIDAVYATAEGGGRPAIVPTSVSVNGALDEKTRIAIIATLDVWLYRDVYNGESIAHSAAAAQLREITETRRLLDWWTRFTARWIPLDSTSPAVQAFWTFDTTVVEEPGTNEAKVGALAIHAERSVLGTTGGSVELPGSIVTGKRPSEDSNLGLYVIGGTLTALVVGTGVLIYKRRRR